VTDDPGTLAVDLPPTPATEARLRRYQGIRQGLGLPRIEVVRLGRSTRVSWRRLPPPLDLDAAPTELVEMALAWLVRLEQTWGESLDGSLCREALRHDPRRRAFALGPDLLSPSPRPDLWDALRERLGVAPLGGESSFRRLALVSRVAELSWSVEERVRELTSWAREAAEAADWDQSRDHALKAWTLRPGDMDAGMLALDADRRSPRPRLARQVAQTLAAIPEPPHALRLCLGRYLLAIGDPGARAQAQRAVRSAPEDLRSWRLMAKVAHARGDRDAVLEALGRAARLGDRGALRKLVWASPPAVWMPVASAWSGALDAQVLGWHLRALSAEARHSRVMRVLTAHLSLLSGLDESALQAVCAAALSTPGASMRLREALRPAVHGGAPPPVVRTYLRLCVEDDRLDEAIAVADGHPGVVRRGALLELRMAAGRFQEVLERTCAGEGMAMLRMKALAWLALDAPHPPPRGLLVSVARDVAAEGLAAVARREILDELRTRFPTHPTLAALDEALDETLSEIRNAALSREEART